MRSRALRFQCWPVGFQEPSMRTGSDTNVSCIRYGQVVNRGHVAKHRCAESYDKRSPRWGLWLLSVDSSRCCELTNVAVGLIARPHICTRSQSCYRRDGPRTIRRPPRDELPPVWPWREGGTRGIALEPLYRTAPAAALRDPILYGLLALVDVIRDGRARGRKIAE
jgi:hypothetical protein